MRDVSKAWFANGTVLAVASWSEAEIQLKVVLLALTCVYTGIKIYRQVFSKQTSTKSEETE